MELPVLETRWKLEGRRHNQKETGMNKTGTVWGMSAGEKNEAEIKLYSELGRHGERVMERVSNDTKFRRQWVQFAISDGVQLSTDQRTAQLLMCEQNFFGVPQWLTHYARFGVQFTRQQLRLVARFPWSGEVLNEPCPFNEGKLVRDTHFAFLGFDRVNSQPLSINRWQEWQPISGQPRFYSYEDNCWYGNNGKNPNQPFARETTCELRWYLLLKEIVPGSLRKPYSQQLTMLPSAYEPPTAIEEVTKHMLFGLLNPGCYLNKNVWARCLDLSFSNSRLSVGLSFPVGVDVADWHVVAKPDVGLGASRKLPQ